MDSRDGGWLVAVRDVAGAAVTPCMLRARTLGCAAERP